MNKTINDMVREVVEGEGDCVTFTEWDTRVCDMGHEECYMSVCPTCGTIDRDCEYKR